MIAKNRRKQGIKRRPGTPFIERFWAKVDKRGPDECWPWLGKGHCRGYGAIALDPVGDQIHGRQIRANRASWIVNRGQITEDQHVLHSCDNPNCVNPNHLFLGDQLLNMRDMHGKGRAPVGSRHGQSKLTEEDVIWLRRIPSKRDGSLRKAALKLGITADYASAIRRRKAWAHLP